MTLRIPLPLAVGIRHQAIEEGRSVSSWIIRLLADRVGADIKTDLVRVMKEPGTVTGGPIHWPVVSSPEEDGMNTDPLAKFKTEEGWPHIVGKRCPKHGIALVTRDRHAACIDDALRQWENRA